MKKMFRKYNLSILDLESKHLRYLSCIEKFIQPQTLIPEDYLNYKIYVNVMKWMVCMYGFGDLLRNSILHVILVHVCGVFTDQGHIFTCKKFTGTQVKANATFEFVIENEPRILYCLQAIASTDDGIAQCLVGCEVVSEVNQANIVHGLVFNENNWVIVRSCNDCVELDEAYRYPLVRGCNINVDVLRELTGMIYAILADLK